VVGTIPLMPFIVSVFVSLGAKVQFVYSIVGTFLAFIFTGYMRARITGGSIARSAIETVLIGGVAAGIAYGVGVALKGLGV
jgi:VIT1/CCC1 family predicted Fe2+/Mn2+ transporter